MDHSYFLFWNRKMIVFQDCEVDFEPTLHLYMLKNHPICVDLGNNVGYRLNMEILQR
jgi:hypothetical protein